MKSFDDWFDELTNGNQIWAEQISMHHKPKTFEDCVRKVYNKYLADEIFPPMQVARGYVGNVLAKVQPDKTYSKDWVTKALQKHEEEQKEEWVPVSEEERQRRLAEYKAMIDGSQTISAIPRMTAKEIIEQGDWRAVQPLEVRSDFEKALIFEEHLEKVRKARTEVFIKAYPDASEEEVNAYLEKFKDKI